MDKGNPPKRYNNQEFPKVLDDIYTWIESRSWQRLSRRPPEWQPWIITSQGRLPLSHEELNQRRYYCNDIVYPGKVRYSQSVITDFIEDRSRGDLAATFDRIKATYRKYLDFSDPRTYDYLTAWTVGTSFLPALRLLPLPAFHRYKRSR